MSIRSVSSCSSRLNRHSSSSNVAAVFWIKGIHGLESFTFDANPVLVGSASCCDLQVKAEGVFEKHALIEYHPLTRSFWVRDLHTTNEGGAIGHTVCNSRPIYGMVNLKTNDRLRFGESVEHIFEMMPAIVQKKVPEKSYSSSAQKRPTNSSSTDGSSDRDSNITLPIVGHRIFPKDHRERFVRPAVVNQRLCRLRNNVPRLVDAGKSLSLAGDLTHPDDLKRSTSLSDNSKNNARKKNKPNVQSVAVTSGSEQTSGRLDRWTDLGVSIDSNNTVGNQLVQRIVRLQNELHRKEMEIEQLKEKALPHLSNNIELQANGNSNNDNLLTENPNSKLNELVYQTFFTVSSEEIEQLSKRITSTSIRDYSDVFNEAYRLLQEPFSYRLMEISTKCSNVFKKLQVTNEEREELYNLLDSFFRDRLNPISKAFDAFLPILKEATGMARESVRACTVFSQWSREFGDQLQLNPNADHMLYKVEDLQTRFREHNMTKHWIPPSISPLMKILIYEFKNKSDELTRKENEYTSTVKQLTEQIAELEMKLHQQSTHPMIIEQNMDEVTFLRSENEALKSANNQLEDRLRHEESEDTDLPIERVRREDRPRTAVGMRLPSRHQMDLKEEVVGLKNYSKAVSSIVESCSRPSSEEEIESEDEEQMRQQAYANEVPNLPDDQERGYDEWIDDQIKPEINKQVSGFNKLDGAQEGACESKGQIRDCRDAPNKKEENEENEENEGNNEENGSQKSNKDSDQGRDDNDRNSQNEKRNENNDVEEKDAEDELNEFEQNEPVESHRSEESKTNDEDLEEEEEHMSDMETSNNERKNTQATEADIEANILDQRRVSEPALVSTMPVYEERKQHAIEFWELAQLLSQVLNLKLPEQDDADFTAIDLDEGVHIEKHRREVTVNVIMDKIRDILDKIRLVEQQRGIASRQQSVRSNKSVDDENNSKVRSGSVSNASSTSVRRHLPRELSLSFPAVESIIEGESAL